MTSRVYLFDSDPNDLRGRKSQLRSLGGELDIYATSSRNQLLQWIYSDATTSPRRLSVALIDAKASPLDLEVTGLRIIETIRRHETLCRVTKPLLWVDAPSTELCQTGPAGVRAEAVVDDEWIDEEDGRPLLEVIEWASRRPPRSFERASSSPRFWSRDQDSTSTLPASRVLEMRRARDEMFERRFDMPPSDLCYTILWGIADELELAFLDWYLGEIELAPSERAARKKREQLQSALMDEKDELDNAHASYIREAKGFIASSPLQTLNPLIEVSWPRFSHISDLVQSFEKERQDVQRLAFIEKGIAGALKTFLQSIGPVGDKKTRERYELIKVEVDRLAAALEISPGFLNSRLQHAAHSLDDAHDDFATHGPPRLDN